MCDRFHEWEERIHKYCEENNLDFQKACSMKKCCDEDTLLLQYYDPEMGKRGLIDETPAPIVLVVRREGNGVAFEQTEHTEKYLKKASEI